MTGEFEGDKRKMTKEELRKEATTTVEWECTPMIARPTFINGYITSAEPREKRIEKLKAQYDYAFNQLCKSREILCQMLSQYRDKKEIDYSTRECGEKLLKEGIYKND